MSDKLFNENTNVEEYKFASPIKGYPELRWRGKRPFTSTQYYPAQLKERYGELTDGWINKIYWGDNLQVMSHLLKEYRGKVKLIYIDPPFDSKAEYKKKIKLKGKKITNDTSSFEEKQYTDIWTNDEYLQYVYERIILLKELLADNGTIYLHCDWHKVHHLRCIMDEVFGADNFRNEIIWHYDIGTAPKLDFKKKHDNILRYSKTNDYIYNEIRIPPTNIDRYDQEDDDGRQYMVRGDSGKIVYADEGQAEDDVWTFYKTDDLRTLNSMSDERRLINYPTQKSEYLIGRIIEASSNEGDLILDCFMGSGTVQAVAMKMGRRFIGADINLGSIQTTVKRLLNIQKEHKDNKLPGIKKMFTGFELYNVNHYDFFKNEVEAKELLMEALEIQKLNKNIIFDGEKDGGLVKIIPVNRIATKADLTSIISNIDYKKYHKRSEETPNKPVEKITLVCMGHEPDLKVTLENELSPLNFDIEIVDVLRDKSNLEFKRDSEAEILIKEDQLVIESFYPMNLLQKLSLMKENVEDWKELVESIIIDWNYDGAILEPSIFDVPGKNELVKGVYEIPEKAGTIRVKITDLLSESLEWEVQNV